MLLAFPWEREPSILPIPPRADTVGTWTPGLGSRGTQEVGGGSSFSKARRAVFVRYLNPVEVSTWSLGQCVFLKAGFTFFPSSASRELSWHSSGGSCSPACAPHSRTPGHSGPHFPYTSTNTYPHLHAHTRCSRLPLCSPLGSHALPRLDTAQGPPLCPTSPLPSSGGWGQAAFRSFQGELRQAPQVPPP